MNSEESFTSKNGSVLMGSLEVYFENIPQSGAGVSEGKLVYVFA